MILSTIYVHYKGGKYTVVGMCEDSTNRPTDIFPGDISTEEPMVLYVSRDHPGALKARALSQWIEIVEWPDGKRRPRFVVEGEESK